MHTNLLKVVWRDIDVASERPPYNEVVYLESLKTKESSRLSSNSDAARITRLSVRFECDDAGAN